MHNVTKKTLKTLDALAIDTWRIIVITK